MIHMLFYRHSRYFSVFYFSIVHLLSCLHACMRMLLCAAACWYAVTAIAIVCVWHTHMYFNLIYIYINIYFFFVYIYIYVVFIVVCFTHRGVREYSTTYPRCCNTALHFTIYYIACTVAVPAWVFCVGAFRCTHHHHILLCTVGAPQHPHAGSDARCIVGLPHVVW